MTTIVKGDCRDILRLMGEGEIDCCVTSPPYFGLRDYGAEGQIGLEQTPDEYVAQMVAVFREVRRVLKKEGTLWLNLGDSYAAQRGGTCQPAETLAGGKHGFTKDGERVNRDRFDGYNPSRNASAIGLKHKDLIGIPWRVAFALQADGWYLRQDIIWHKPNPMPESVRDRCTKSHEYIFLLSKSERYYFDNKAIAEDCVRGYAGSSFNKGKTAEHQLGRSSTKEREESGKRNKRDVWTVATKPYKGAHFATFPPELIRPCVLVGCPKGGTVLDPFGGSGTTGQVANEEGREAFLIELNPSYIELAKNRTKENTK